MDDPSSGGAHAEAAQLQGRKRLVYLVALAGGVAIFLLSWSIRGPDDPFLTYLYPLFAGLLAGLWLALWRRPGWLMRLEPWMLGLVAAIVLARLGWHFHAGGSLDDHLLVLAGGHYWAVGIVILAAFVMLDHRAGLRAGLAILIVASLIALAGVIGEALDGTLATETAVYLLRVHLFLGVLLVLASIATSMRDTVKDALVRSEAMARAARTDPLTGLANRRAAEAFLDRQAAAVARYGHPVAVIGMDIDHFKAVNDAHGHACGDAVIEGVARRLEANLREPDFVARWGGEEFLIVAPETSAHEAQQLAERCRAALASEPIAGVPVTGSFGITVFRAGDTLDDVLGRADNLMYAAKAAGRDRVLVE